MITATQKKESAIVRGIKTVAIGKKGSKPLSPELIEEVLLELQSQMIPAVQKGAFFGALFMKGITPEEKKLQEVLPAGTLEDPDLLVEYLASDATKYVKTYCRNILNHKTLSKQDAQEMGRFLFSNEAGDGARGLFASVLRVRYETADEYSGLLESMQETLEGPFRKLTPPGEPIIQVAEPFDGVDQSYMITPLLAHALQDLKYRVVCLVGRNSGPKCGNNLLDLANALGASFLRNPDDWQKEKPPLGWYIRQQDISSAIDRWVELRRKIIKRPFLATLERFVNPVGATIIIASAFHPPYGEKMLTVCERAGYPGIIINRNGIEGTIAFALKRPAKILCSMQKKDGTYNRYEFEFDPEEYLGQKVPIEERLESPSLEKNAALIQEYLNQEQTENPLFNLRVQATCAGLRKAIDWIEEYRGQ